MTKKKDPNKPAKERARLNSCQQVNDEIRRLYRRYANGDITHVVLTKRIATLTALRSGLPETVEKPRAPETPMAVNIQSVASGQQFCPGNEVLMPFEMAGRAWEAHNAGKEAWAEYLLEVEGQLTQKAFANLSRVAPHDRKTLELSEEPRLHLVPKAPEETSEATGTRLEAALSGMSSAAIRSMTIAELMQKTGWDMGPDDAA